MQLFYWPKHNLTYEDSIPTQAFGKQESNNLHTRKVQLTYLNDSIRIPR